MPDFTQSAWIALDVPLAVEGIAKAIRADRDKLYRNIYEESSTDARWVGDLGEIMLNDWIADEGYQDFDWIRDDAAGKPDFLLGTGARVGAKTVKRKAAPQPEYTAQVTARHAKEPVDWFFFMSYDIAKRQMWLLGAIDKERFLERARYYPAGAQVHPNYTIRAGHEIYNIELAKLTPPRVWLNAIKDSSELEKNELATH